jgi:hypothetical protein
MGETGENPRSIQRSEDVVSRAVRRIVPSQSVETLFRVEDDLDFLRALRNYDLAGNAPVV